MAWQKIYSIKKVFSKRYSNVSSINESTILQTGVWESPKTMVSSSFIGGGAMGKRVVADGEMKKDGNLRVSVDMKDELLAQDIVADLKNGTALPVSYSISSCSGLTVKYVWVSEPTPWGDSPTVRVRVFVNNSVVYTSADLYRGEPATPYEFSTMIGGSMVTAVHYISYSNYNISYSDSVRVELFNNSKVYGFVNVSIDSVKKSVDNLSNEVDVLAIE